MKKEISKAISFFIAAFVIFVAFLYQNCTPVNYSRIAVPEAKISGGTGGNGGPYTGVFKIYHHYSSVQPCRVHDRSNQPLANTSILFRDNSQGMLAPYLARENCEDLRDPTPIADSDIKLNGSSFENLTYKNLSMTAFHPVSDFDVVAASCPAGLSPIPGAQRTNLFSHSLDWTQMMGSPALGSDFRFLPNAIHGWYAYPGIGVQLQSTIQGLPAFLVDRPLSTNLENWSRHSQYIQLKPDTDYQFSFVAQSGSVNGVDFHLYRGVNSTPGPLDDSVMVTYNLQSGTASVQYSQNVTQVQAAISPFGNAYLCTVSFRSSTAAGDRVTNLGVTPTAYGQPTGKTGDSFIGTAAQLLEVKSFCQ